MIDPPVPWATIALPTADASRAGARRLIVIVSSNLSGSVSVAGSRIRDSGVVDEDVQPAERGRRLLGQPHRRVMLCEIDCGGDDLGSELLGECRFGRAQCRAVTSAEHEFRAGGGEGPGDVGADALGGAGDQRPLAVEAQTGGRAIQRVSSGRFGLSSMALAVAGSVTSWLK